METETLRNLMRAMPEPSHAQHTVHAGGQPCPVCTPRVYALEASKHRKAVA